MAPPRQTIAAPAADYVTLAADDIAGEEIVDIRAHFDDFAYELVPDRHGHRDGALRPLIPFVDMHVGAADAGAQHLDQYVADADLRRLDFFQPQPRFAPALHQCFHIHHHSN